MNASIVSRLFCTLFLALVLVLGPSGVLANSEVNGVFGLNPVSETTALAIWVNVPEGQAIEGLRWYNNDAAVQFPALLAMAGDQNERDSVAEAVPVRGPFSGQTSSWSECLFDVPVTSLSDGIYFIFRFPLNAVFNYEGQGGGAALGYMDGDGEQRCWVTGDGENWYPVTVGMGFAVEAVVSSEKSSEVLVLGSSPQEEREIEAPLPEINLQLAARVVPNPFNPTTEIRYSLPHSGNTAIDLFDLRGQRIRQIFIGYKDAGIHAIKWDGRDDAGRSVASGVYVVRVRNESSSVTARLTLVR